jgi:hypothetical protein
MQPLNFIADYYGEKFGFYFAWLVNYTAWLLPLAIVGVIFFVLQVIIAMQRVALKNENLTACLHTVGADKAACKDKFPPTNINLGELDN